MDEIPVDQRIDIEPEPHAHENDGEQVDGTKNNARERAYFALARGSSISVSRTGTSGRIADMLRIIMDALRTGVVTTRSPAEPSVPPDRFRGYIPRPRALHF